MRLAMSMLPCQSCQAASQERKYADRNTARRRSQFPSTSSCKLSFGLLPLGFRYPSLIARAFSKAPLNALRTPDLSGNARFFEVFFRIELRLILFERH